MPDTNIGAGAVILSLESATPDTFVDVGQLYDPLPEVDFTRESLDDTNTKSATERTKAGIRKIAPLAFKVKTTADGYADMKTLAGTGEEKRWKYIIPDDSGAAGGTEELIVKAWVSGVKRIPAMKDETFIMLTLNINELEGM